MNMHHARRHSTPVFAAIGVVLVAWLGNMRPAVSETTSSAAEGATAAVGPVAAVCSAGRSEQGRSESGVRDRRFLSGAPLDPDDASLVPAIFAWDPEVRFVYFRHVSKWM